MSEFSLIQFPQEMEAQALENARNVIKGVRGRVADGTITLTLLQCLSALAGDGDHLEIGTLFGGSAVAVALMRKQCEIAGKVVCCDPLNGFYIGVTRDNGASLSSDKDGCGLAPSPEIVRENAAYFGVSLEIVQAKSYPWPAELENRQFVTAYIDGDHWNEGPMRDWLNVKDRAQKFVIFDNYDNDHPAVMRACAVAAEDPDWEAVIQKNISFVLRRRAV